MKSSLPFHPNYRAASDEYPEVAQFLGTLVRKIKDILAAQLVGVYLFGSLTGPDFDRHSDIDVLAVTEERLIESVMGELADMHGRLAAMPVWCADQLEISYIPRAALRRYDPADNIHLHLDRGKSQQLKMTPHHVDWVIQRYVLRERGIALDGPDPSTLIDTISIEELQQATSSLLNTWLAGFLDEPDAVGTVGYQSYLALTVCRVLYTLIEGGVVSKRAAVDWAKEALDQRWKPLVEAAWRDRQDPNWPVSPKATNELQNFISYGIAMDKGAHIKPGRNCKTSG